MDYWEGETFTTLKFLSLASCEFIDCHFVNLDLSDQSSKNTKFIECSFHQCNLSGVDLLNGVFRNVIFSECKMIGLNWSNCQNLSLLEIKNSLLDFCVFQELDLSHCTFENSSIKDADFSQSKLVGASFAQSHLRATSFNGCDLSEADFRGASEYSIDPHFTKIRKAKFSMPEAMTLLEHYEIVID